MNLYKNHSNTELVAVLKDSNKLTYEAQLNLSKEIDIRNLKEDKQELLNQIHTIESAIVNLEYLKDLGFKCTQDIDVHRIELNRTTNAKILDAVSMVLGTILSLVGLIYLWLLLAMFFGDNEFSLSKLVTYGLMIIVGGIGFKMLNGINRFLDNRNFNIVQLGEVVRLKNYQKKEEQIFSSSDVILVEEGGDELILKIGETEIIRADAENLLQKMTIEELARKMKTNG